MAKIFINQFYYSFLQQDESSSDESTTVDTSQDEIISKSKQVMSSPSSEIDVVKLPALSDTEADEPSTVGKTKAKGIDAIAKRLIDRQRQSVSSGSSSYHQRLV